MGKRRGTTKQHGMEVDKRKTGGAGADEEGWVAGPLPMEGEAGGVAPPGSVGTGGDSAASKHIGRFGVVSGGVKKRKVQMTFKQKRRKSGKLQKAIAHAEVKGGKKSKASSTTERKQMLKKLW